MKYKEVEKETEAYLAGGFILINEIESYRMLAKLHKNDGVVACVELCTDYDEPHRFSMYYEQIEKLNEMIKNG